MIENLSNNSSLLYKKLPLLPSSLSSKSASWVQWEFFYRGSFQVKGIVPCWFFPTLLPLLAHSYLSFKTTLRHFLYFCYPPSCRFCLPCIHVSSGSCTLISLGILSTLIFNEIDMVWVGLMRVGMLLRLN